jgi:hypothetical protein
LVVVFAIRLEQISGVRDGRELGLDEALVAELAVEALDVPVLGRLSRGDEAMTDRVFMRPALEGLTRELRSVVGEQVNPKNSLSAFLWSRRVRGAAPGISRRYAMTSARSAVAGGYLFVVREPRAARHTRGAPDAAPAQGRVGTEGSDSKGS